MKRDGFITAIYLRLFPQVLDVSSESVFSTSAQMGHSALTLEELFLKETKAFLLNRPDFSFHLTEKERIKHNKLMHS